MATATAPIAEVAAACYRGPEFDRLAAAYTEEFSPRGEHEEFLVTLMARARFNIERFRRIEDVATERALDDATTANLDLLAKIEKLIEAAERSYNRAHRELSAKRRAHLHDQAKAADLWIRQALECPRPPRPAEPESEPATAVPAAGRRTADNLALRL